MGYLRFLAVIAGLDDTSSLHVISETIPWRAYRMRRSGLVLIEWLKRPNPNDTPQGRGIFPTKPAFACRPSGISFASNFGSNAKGLDELYAELQLHRRAGSFPAVAVHTTLLHSLTGQPVLGIASDDDDWDFVCEPREGAIHKVRFISEDDEFCIGRSGQIDKIDKGSAPRILHQIAMDESAMWSDELLALFGFDGCGDNLDLVEVDRCRPASGPTDLRMANKHPFWRPW